MLLDDYASQTVGGSAVNLAALFHFQPLANNGGSVSSSVPPSTASVASSGSSSSSSSSSSSGPIDSGAAEATTANTTTMLPASSTGEQQHCRPPPSGLFSAPVHQGQGGSPPSAAVAPNLILGGTGTTLAANGSAALLLQNLSSAGAQQQQGFSPQQQVGCLFLFVQHYYSLVTKFIWRIKLPLAKLDGRLCALRPQEAAVNDTPATATIAQSRCSCSPHSAIAPEDDISCFPAPATDGSCLFTRSCRNPATAATTLLGQTAAITKTHININYK